MTLHIEKAGRVPQGYLRPSTVYDYFVRQGLTRTGRPRKQAAYSRYQARHRNQRWIGDAHHLLYLPQPDGSRRKVFLVAWLDDWSRLLVHGQIYTAERLPMVEDALKKAIIKYGLPEQVYVEYVPRNIFHIMLPAALCAGGPRQALNDGRGGPTIPVDGHITITATPAS